MTPARKSWAMKPPGSSASPGVSRTIPHATIPPITEAAEARTSIHAMERMP